jgi:AhpD family alkylhydroperoxidase
MRDELWLAGGRREESRKAMRIEAKPREAYPWYLQPFFGNQRRKHGRVLDAALLWARSPKLFVAVALLYGAIDRKSSPTEPALRSLLTVRVSQLNHCRFCIDINSATLLKRGIGRDKLWALEDWRRSSLFVERERAALEYAEAITRSDLEVDDALMARLRAHFDDDAIVELTALIAFQNMSSKFNATLDVPPQGLCRLPETRQDGQERPELSQPPGLEGGKQV